MDSIEHGNFCDEDALQALAASDAVWVPTIVTVKNLLGDGRFPEQVVKNIWEGQKKALLAGISSEQNLLSEVMPEPIVSSTVRDFLMNTGFPEILEEDFRTGKSGSETVTADKRKILIARQRKKNLTAEIPVAKK